ncbi:hypothetical protein B0H16DRAFT_1695623 [Mycena metata]|uniref:Uncharacterized protein n=1 Tax=Mycena metata TaxID=1033252 RepID=A0AAD7MY18_9AGAR|nr:hypothetical protein B0H16DRAFT_1695623 [Mycena metata]
MRDLLQVVPGEAKVENAGSMGVIWLRYPAVAARKTKLISGVEKATNRRGGMNWRKGKGMRTQAQRSGVSRETNPESNKDKMSSYQRMVKRGCFGVYPESILAKPEWCPRGTRHIAEIPVTSGVMTGGIVKVGTEARWRLSVKMHPRGQGLTSPRTGKNTRGQSPECGCWHQSREISIEGSRNWWLSRDMAKTADGGGPGPTAQRSAGGEVVELRVSGKFGDNAGVTGDASRVTYSQREMTTTRGWGPDKPEMVRKPSGAAQQLPEWVEVVMEENGGNRVCNHPRPSKAFGAPERIEVVIEDPECNRNAPGAHKGNRKQMRPAKDPENTVMSLSQEGRSMRNIRSYDQSRTKPILGDEQMSRSALLGTPQLSKGDRLTGLGLRDGNVSDTKVRYGPERSVRRSEPERTRGISKKQETTRSRTAVVGMAERELRGRDRRFRRRDRRPEVTGVPERTRGRREQGHYVGDVKRQ